MELVYMDGKKEQYTTSEIIAECAEVQHHTITRLIRENKADFEELGILGFKIHKLDTRGQPKKSYILNEQQATLLITYLKNTETVRQFKLNLVKAFFEMREELSEIRLQRALEKPKRKTLHDSIETWPNAPKHAHSTMNNLLLKAVTDMNAKHFFENEAEQQAYIEHAEKEYLEATVTLKYILFNSKNGTQKANKSCLIEKFEEAMQ